MRRFSLSRYSPVSQFTAFGCVFYSIEALLPSYLMFSLLQLNQMLQPTYEEFFGSIDGYLLGVHFAVSMVNLIVAILSILALIIVPYTKVLMHTFTTSFAMNVFYTLAIVFGMFRHSSFFAAPRMRTNYGKYPIWCNEFFVSSIVVIVVHVIVCAAFVFGYVRYQKQRRNKAHGF
ncbi:hypothetical protein L596_012663 [Steinernema carpocapsae]|uniref:Uncharacterized protein n=1 Tax=Steinernema carpocapsae TaxID=34508 RepID=A0A4U5NYD7_STECR|nr:hypothetical protein L596_012663 [Steinernema carpocapsae]